MKRKKCLSFLLATCLAVSLCLPATAAFAHGDEIVKSKQMQTDRQETAEDKAFRQGMHRTYEDQKDSPYGTGAYLYQTLTITGDAIGEQQEYAVREVEELADLTIRTNAMHKIGLTATATYQLQDDAQPEKRTLEGLDFVQFLGLCGLQEKTSEPIYLQFYSDGDQEKPALTMTWQALQEAAQNEKQPVLLAFGLDTKPLVKNTDRQGYDSSAGNLGGPLRLIIPQKDKAALYVNDLRKVVASKNQDAAAPQYIFHNREPFTQSLGAKFTVNVYGQGQTLTLLKTKTFNTKDMEQLAVAYPQYVYSNYYGPIGDRQSMRSMGLGGWVDYFYGLDLWWLLNQQVGLPSTKGYAELRGRDGQVYTKIEDLAYLQNAQSNPAAYTITTPDGVDIPDAVPMIAFAKNGYPLLPEHDHESSGYHDYNQLNKNLDKQGVRTEVGVIKNHSGPFVACLGNFTGLYGGYQVETAGDCVQIDLYLDTDSAGFTDVNQHWAKQAIQFVTSKGWLQGTTNTTFEPNAPMTRGMLATVLGRMANAQPTAKAAFADVTETAYYSPYVAWGVEQGFMQGVGDNLFAPEQPISRQELAVALAHYIEKQATAQLPAGTAVSFHDEAKIADWAKQSVEKVVAYGIMKGDEAGNFLPENTATRGEIATVLMQLTTALEKGATVNE